jgi:hypothetical protein
MKNAVLNAARHLLAPLVRLLLRSGVTWTEFADLAKEVFVEVARSDYGVQGRPTNTARVAMITGLSRREAARVRDLLVGAARPVPPPESRISQVLSGWHLDPDFSDGHGKPAVLAMGGERLSLSALLKRYAGDLPHVAFVKEMRTLGLVEKVGKGYRVLARDYLRGPGDPDLVRQAGVALHDHAATLAHNLDTGREGPARFEGMASTAQLAPRYARAFAELAARRSQAFLEEMDAWLLGHEVKPSQSHVTAGGVRIGVGVYLIRDAVRRGRRK